MSTRTGYDRIDTEQTVEYLALLAVILLAALIGALYVGHQLTELIFAAWSAVQV